MTSADDPTPSVVVVPRYFSISKFDEQLYPSLAPLTPKVLVFDLSRCTFIESSALLYLLALFTMRLKRSLLTRIRLPRNKSVLDFLQIWRFPEAFRAAAGRKLSEFTEGENLRYFDTPPDELQNRYAGTKAPTHHGFDRLLSNYYFEINTFGRQMDLFGSSFALTEAARWRQLATVLRHVLAGPETLFASRIVYEGLVNAIRHPTADTIQIVSQVRWRVPGRAGEFFLTIWDDGQPIATTLQRTLLRGQPIVSGAEVGLDVHYNVTVTEANTRDSRSTNSRQIPTSDAPEQDLLLASVFPGTTSDPLGHRPPPRELNDARDAPLLQPGMGLYLLTNAAVAVYGGSVDVRSGHWRLSVSSSSHGADYDAELTAFTSWPLFRGNLITVRLPLRSATGAANG